MGSHSMDSNFFDVTVSSKTLLTPGMLRITFCGDDLRNFRTTGMADEYLRLFFEDEATGELVLPIIDGEGRWSYHEDRPPVRCSTYTVRRFDRRRCELDVDFVVHPGGVASEWAQRAQAGHRMVVNNPRGLYTPTEGLPWQLILADATGIPAAARLIEQKPGDLACRVVIEVATPDQIQPLPERDNVVVTWLTDSGNGHWKSRLGDVFPLIPLPPGPGHIWAAGEQEAIRTIRKHVKNTLKLKPERHKLVAYWIDDERLRPRRPPLDTTVLAALSTPWKPAGLQS